MVVFVCADFGPCGLGGDVATGEKILRPTHRRRERLVLVYGRNHRFEAEKKRSDDLGTLGGSANGSTGHDPVVWCAVGG